MTGKQRSALRKALTAHSDWRAWSLRNQLKIESMRVTDLLRAAQELGVDMQAVTPKPRLKLTIDGGILIFSPSGKWESYERQT